VGETRDPSGPGLHGIKKCKSIVLQEHGQQGAIFCYYYLSFRIHYHLFHDRFHPQFPGCV